MRAVIAAQRTHTNPLVPADDPSYAALYSKVIAEDTFSIADSSGSCVLTGGIGWSDGWNIAHILAQILPAQMTFEGYANGTVPILWYSIYNRYGFFIFYIHDAIEYGWRDSLYTSQQGLDASVITARSDFEILTLQDPAIYIGYDGEGWSTSWVESGIVESITARDNFEQYAASYSSPYCGNYYTLPCWNSSMDKGSGFVGAWLCRFNWIGSCD